MVLSLTPFLVIRKEQEERNGENEYTKILSVSSAVKGIRNGAVLKGELRPKAGFKKTGKGGREEQHASMLMRMIQWREQRGCRDGMRNEGEQKECP